ncbi:glyoxalase [Alkalihalobacillus alcalophilus ATCC 27647 = CGMCC 1.3604]|uniref:Glyoxalase n=1 Tax=Alkalihalobacillus alcalophilus ATCC 27647 = CGMCC 1.3604 TaxID=1218173 RepID=A0A094XFG6_ALKAL|nr:VOC family protein [Alkalihalobacillus alcalophilus]KGA97530.1 glyoxalase [Alkalihalobacillus alcalophilus ATCC 27647 = CGMCC 1.3604]MED1560783.1 VOC family protein [Alkalihalobacillus alcalophilus]THG92429.1 glyoxalase [Alkalihalobacillus alcalophilus ATCC 27647 = CGMCC 1.3604]
MNTSIKKIGQIGVPVKKLERAIEFYQKKLALSLLFHTDSMAFLQCDRQTVLLTLPEKEEFAHKSSVLYFQVDHLKESYESMLNNGVSFIDEPHFVAKVGSKETWMVFFQDSEENTHALMSEVQTGD